MLAVARPEPRFSLHRTGSDQRVTQFNRMALAVTPEVFSGATAHRGVYGDAEQSIEQRFECGIFSRASASPEFGGAEGGVEDQRVGLADFEPPRHYVLVPASRYLDQDVRVGKDGHRSPKRSSLEPRRDSLISSELSTALVRDFRIPTKPCIADMRASWGPRYRSRAACRTNSEIVVFSVRARAWSAPQSWSSRNSCVRLMMYIIHLRAGRCADCQSLGDFSFLIWLGRDLTSQTFDQRKCPLSDFEPLSQSQTPEVNARAQGSSNRPPFSSHP